MDLLSTLNKLRTGSQRQMCMYRYIIEAGVCVYRYIIEAGGSKDEQGSNPNNLLYTASGLAG